MNVDLLCLTVVLLSSPLLTLCEPLYVLSAPNLLRIGSSENVFVEAQDYNGVDLNVNIMVKNFPTKSNDLLRKTVTLTRANNYQILTDIQIPADEKYFNRDVEKQYVYLQAQFPSQTLEKVVMVSFQSGYIFVQTDKPIYTPESTVNYRIFTLTPNLHISSSAILVEIMNPQGITIHSETVFPPQGMKSKWYKLPEIASPGIWKVVTRYKDTPQKTFTADFEVKEYVLPTIDATLSTNPYFYVRDEELKVKVNAKYLFGRNVEGQAYVVFGIMDDNGKSSITDSLQRITIVNGKGTATLTREMIIQTFTSIDEQIGKSIYITANVLTDTGSEMVEVEKRGIKIVKSPYTIHFKKTPQFFKVGMPFDVSVYVTNPDNTPAENVPVEVSPGGRQDKTKANGIAKINVNVIGQISTLDITVMTKDNKLEDEQQAVKTMTAHAYKPKAGSNNYLHIGIDAAELEIGDQKKVSLTVPTGLKIQNHDYTYMIISKGQILRVAREKRQGQSLIIVPLPVTKDMVPSFRFVAYYHVGSDEVVSDSIWVDVKDTCMGTLKLELQDDEKEENKKPHDLVKLQITGDPGAKVGLVVVDKAVQVLNKNRLTQSKIWDVIEEHDTGCTAGSGSDSMGVFYDAGLMFQSSTAGGTNSRTRHDCPDPPKRRRRAENLLQVTARLSDKYADELKKCCVDGMRDNKLGYTCERRIMYIEDGPDCIKAFLDCCNEVKNSQKKFGEAEMFLARSTKTDEYFENIDDIVSRSVFPESWFWNEEMLPMCESRTCSVKPQQNMYLKDSITTWQILAISMSDTHGICVADPLEMVVFKNFFIDLKMPYSVVRNEQVEIKAIIHNYTSRKMKRVHVEFTETKDVCSAASKKGKYETRVEIEPHSSRSVSYVIIPMKLTAEEDTYTIEVKAATSDFTDGVKKTLKVVSEGVLRNETIKSVLLNPALNGGKQHVHVRSDKPLDQVPGTPSGVFVSVSGDDISETIDYIIKGGDLSRLIYLPSGCGEQNVMHMTLPLIATHYLDSTNQWDTLGMERREQAIEFINRGYQQQLAFRKPLDGSFGAWSHSPSGTWLTAYVAKIFAMSSTYISIEETVLCSALKWLVLNKQLPDGSFKDDQPIYTLDMGGDIRGKDGEASLTAFVLIAMQEGREICASSVGSLHDSMRKAVDYLESKLQQLTNPYAVAMTSYAMANAEKFNKDVLMKSSTKHQAGTAWMVPKEHYHSLEATAYAVLALVKAEDYDTAGEAVDWLATQQSQYGSYKSTQATIMVFQAISNYRTHVRNRKEYKLDVELNVVGRKKQITWSFSPQNVHLRRSDKTELNKDFNVTAIGTGKATLSVHRMYYAKPADNVNDCRQFELSVTFTRDRKESYGGALESYTLTLEFLYLEESGNSMGILDVGILTGFVVDERDLTQLVISKDRVIQKFEKDNKLSERGSLIIYLNKFLHKTTEKIVFRMHKIHKVGLLQPAGVSIYKYYSPDQRCTKYFHPEKQDGALLRLCQGDVCHCAEESCSSQKKNNISDNTRWEKACEATMDYVYKVKVEDINLASYTDVYKMKVENILKEGSDAGDKTNIMFMGHPNCRDKLGLQKDNTYLIMGRFVDISFKENNQQYILGEHTWIEYWPTRTESQSPEYREKYIGLSQLEHKLTTKGCTT